MEQKILVTGGAGYVGSVLVRELLASGFSVRVFDKLLFGDRGLREVAGEIELVQGDIRTFEDDLLDGVDAVINLAGLSNDPMADYNPQANHEMNTVGTERAALAAKRCGVRRFIQASSCSIYDRGASSQDILLDETSDVKARHAYTVSKFEAERILLDLAGADFQPVIFRKGTVYGYSPRMRYDLVVNTFVKDALSAGQLSVHHGGEMWRPMVDVQDVARAYVAALRAPAEDVGGEIFNLVHENYRVLELAHRVRDSVPEPVDVTVSYDAVTPRSYRVSGDKLDRVLGFRSVVSVGESVSNMIEQIHQAGATDFAHPRYYNIEWLKALIELESTLQRVGKVL